MNLNAIQKSILDYIGQNCEKHLQEFGMGKPQVSAEFMDLDKFKNDFTCFLDFNKITFAENGKFNDDCTAAGQINFSIFLVFRNAAADRLRENMLNGASAFYGLMSGAALAPEIQETAVKSIRNYSIVEGTRFVVISEMEIVADFET